MNTMNPAARLCQYGSSNDFPLTEAYDDMAALEAHRKTPHFLLFRERADGGLILGKSSVCGEVIDA